MDRYNEFLDKLKGDMNRRGIKQKDILQYYEGMSNATLINFLKGRSLTMDTMKKVLEYVDNPKNWKK